MRILIIDGQGGGMGCSLIRKIRQRLPYHQITAVGTNAVAASAMHSAGAHHAASGENAVLYNCSRHDIILGPMGIIIANSLLGEITRSIAHGVSESEAYKILVPSCRCNTLVVGTIPKPLEDYLEEAVDEIVRLSIIHPETQLP